MNFTAILSITVICPALWASGALAYDGAAPRPD